MQRLLGALCVVPGSLAYSLLLKHTLQIGPVVNLRMLFAATCHLKHVSSFAPSLPLSLYSRPTTDTAFAVHLGHLLVLETVCAGTLGRQPMCVQHIMRTMWSVDTQQCKTCVNLCLCCEVSGANTSSRCCKDDMRHACWHQAMMRFEQSGTMLLTVPSPWTMPCRSRKTRSPFTYLPHYWR